MLLYNFLGVNSGEYKGLIQTLIPMVSSIKARPALVELEGELEISTKGHAEMKEIQFLRELLGFRMILKVHTIVMIKEKIKGP